MNTGIQDATNLAWKVALAVSGGVDLAPKLLQTYHEERHPAGEAAVRFSGGTLPAAALAQSFPLLCLWLWRLAARSDQLMCCACVLIVTRRR